MRASPPSGQPAWKPVSAWNELELAATANKLVDTDLPTIDVVLAAMFILGIIMIAGVFRLFID